MQGNCMGILSHTNLESKRAVNKYAWCLTWGWGGFFFLVNLNLEFEVCYFGACLHCYVEEVGDYVGLIQFLSSHKVPSVNYYNFRVCCKVP